MPEQESIPSVYQPNLDSEPFIRPGEQIEAGTALALVTRSMHSWEAWRQANVDPKLKNHDALYYGAIAMRTWPGTTTPRSSLSFPIVFEHVEAALPVLVQSIFPNDDWFQASGEESGQSQIVQDIRDKLFYDFEHARGKFRGSARPEIVTAVKQLLQHGNGGVTVRWDAEAQKAVPEFVDIRDIYIDPGTSSPDVSNATSIIRKVTMTFDQIRAYRGQPGMDVPEDAKLYSLAGMPFYTPGEMTVQTSEAYRGVFFGAGTSDFQPNPADRKIEVLIYHTATRIIWVIGRAWVMYNEPNPYGFIPYFFAPCYEVPGRFYARGIADVQDSNQRYTEALFNARLDNVNLTLNPPRATTNGMLLTPAQQRWAPGQTFQVQNPKEDILSLAPPDITSNVYAELQYIDAAAEKRTGLSGAGVPRSGNMSRTAAGVEAQTSGAASRLQQIVANIEDYLIIPMLYAMYYVNRYHLQPEDQVHARESTKTPSRTVSGAVFLNDVSFRIVAASKMLTRDRLQSTFPFLIQYLLAGQFVGEIQKSGKTINFEELFRMLQDATGTADLYDLIREMTPQEQQQIQQEKQQQMQMADRSNQVRLQMGQMKAQTDIQKAQIQKQPTPPDETEQYAKMAEMEFEREKHQMQMQMEQMKLQVEQQLAEMKIQSEAMKAQIDQQKAQMKMQTDAQSSAMKLAGQQKEQEFKMQNSAQDSQLQRYNAELDAEVGRRHSEDEHSMKMDQMRQMSISKMGASPGGKAGPKKAEKKERPK